MIYKRLTELYGEISFICSKLGIKSEDITLVAVTKFASNIDVEEALRFGIKNLGENKVQEAKDKFSHIDQQKYSVTKHMIGHLQSNKVKEAVRLFDMIQTVDSLHLGQEISKQAEKNGRPMDILLQVNVAEEKQKFGLTKEGVDSLIAALMPLSHLRIQGLMTIAPFTRDERIIRSCFNQLKILFDKIAVQFRTSDKVRMRYLSMGMTNDYKIAIEEGANMLRIGRAIFSHD